MEHVRTSRLIARDWTPDADAAFAIYGRDEAIELRHGRAAGTVVGAVPLSRLPGADGHVEIGWHLNPDRWGNGHATEAGRGVVGLAFGRGLRRYAAAAA